MQQQSFRIDDGQIVKHGKKILPEFLKEHFILALLHNSEIE
jgi:hypothetical protein